MHSLHGDIHEIGLQDNCVACAEHAEQPWRDLDAEMLAKLIRRNYHFRFTHEKSTNYSPRSNSEAVAMRNITNLMERMGQLMQVDGGGYIRSYLEKNWRIDFGDN